MSGGAIEAGALDQLFMNARTHSRFVDRRVPDELLVEVYNLARMGPTSANSQPMRIVFVRSREAKEMLRPALSSGNRAKTMDAPATAIFAMDMEFYERLPNQYHDPEARSWFAGKPKAIEEAAMRNATLQAAYFMLAARALGLDCGPMSGFDNAKLDAAFFAGTNWRANFLCNLGFGDRSALHPRDPRLEFQQACMIL
jgi:3-hydroxypropanoate dehydrogenase